MTERENWQVSKEYARVLMKRMENPAISATAFTRLAKQVWAVLQAPTRQG